MLIVIQSTLILSCTKAVLDKAKGTWIYSNLNATSLPQSFDMNLWSHVKLNPARPHFSYSPIAW